MRNSFPQATVLETDPRQSMTGTELELVQANRYPVVARQQSGRDNLGLIAGIAAALVLGAMTMVSMTSARKDKEAATFAAQQAELDAARLAAANQVEALAPAPVVQTPKVQVAVPAVKTPQPAYNANAALDRTRAPALIMDTYNNQPQAVAASQTQAAASTAPRTAPEGLNANESFAFRLGNSGVERAVAAPMENPTTTVAQGTLISAVLETAVNSDLPGYVRAFVSQDVRGFDNTSVLIPRGSRLIGQYKSSVNAGQTRAFILWSRLIRPDGVSVSLSSPATGLDGQTGLPGRVNSHFFKRFGSAILLSLLGGWGGGSPNVVIASSASSAAAVAAQSSAGISPTITVAQGQLIRVFTARDLDFTDVTPDIVIP